MQSPRAVQSKNATNIKSPTSKLVPNGKNFQSPAPSPYKRPSRVKTPSSKK